MNAIMTKMGIGWAARKAASSMNYGKGKQMHNIAQDGAKMTIESTGGASSLNSFVIGGGEQDWTDPGGTKLRVNPVWDGAVLVMNPSNDPAIRRYLQGPS